MTAALRAALAALLVAIAILTLAGPASSESHRRSMSPTSERTVPEIPRFDVVREVVRRLVKYLDDRSPDNFDVHAHKAERHWNQSGGRTCNAPLPPILCTWQVRTTWGVGIALTSGGQVPGAWNSPWSPRHLIFEVTPGRMYWLTCWTAGDTVRGVGTSGQGTNLWYQLGTTGTYVSDGWFFTGTNYPIAGVAHC